MFNFINLTPHIITTVGEGGLIESFPPSGQVARVSSVKKEVAPGYFLQRLGEVQDLPAPVAGTLLIVSGMVRDAVPHRTDVISPGELVRGEDGQPKGCRGFNVNPGFAL